MLITARQAAELLAQEGITRHGTRKLLAAGLAGPGVRTTAATLYEHDQVRALLGRVRLRDTDLDAACPSGVFVARRDLPATEQLAALRDGWRMSIWTLVYVQHLIKELGGLPLIATIQGYIVLGASITGISPSTSAPSSTQSSGSAPSRLVFDLAAPGAWYDALHGRRLEREPGSPWSLRAGMWLGRQESWQPDW